MIKKSRDEKILFLIKLLHTAIWAFMVFCAFYVFYAGITGRMNSFVMVSIIAILIEGTALFLVGKGECPITTWAKKYSSGNEDINFDIFLPGWVTRGHRTTVVVMFISGVVMVIF